MRIVLYEWCSSGGLLAPDAGLIPGSAGSPPPSLLAEGRSMLGALLRDAARMPAADVVLLVDVRERGHFPEAGGRLEVVVVDGPHDVAVLAAAAASADRTIVVAPETAGILASRVGAARGVIAPSARFIALAADKQATVERLASRGVPVPAGRPLEPGAPIPRGFRLPAVIKSRDGCGGDGMAILRGGAGPAAAASRLEAFVEGSPVGVSCLCGPGGHMVLPPMLQRYDESGRHLVGAPAADPRLAARAAALAVRAIAALEGGDSRARGWVGVDMILGRRDDGVGDRVLEVNPRLTTSFVGLSRRCRGGLLGPLLAVADGDRPGELAWSADVASDADDDR